MAVLDSTKTISGTFGKVFHEGQQMLNAKGATVTIENNYEEVKRSGTRRIGNKLMDIKMSGTIQAYKVSHAFAKSVGRITKDDESPLVTELHIKLDDPESDAKEWLIVKGVQFTNIDLINFELGSLVEEELQFVFDDYEYK